MVNWWNRNFLGGKSSQSRGPISVVDSACCEGRRHMRPSIAIGAAAEIPLYVPNHVVRV